MKEFWYTHIEDYLTKSDAYVDPKTIKLYENLAEGSSRKLRAITYLRTALIGWQGRWDEGLEQMLKEHGHCEGRMEEVVAKV